MKALTWIIIEVGHGVVRPSLSRCIVLLADAIFSSFAKLCSNNRFSRTHVATLCGAPSKLAATSRHSLDRMKIEDGPENAGHNL